VSREYAGATVIGRSLCAMGLACALARILLEGVWVEIPGIVLGAAGYSLAGERSGGTGVAVVVLSAVSVVIPSHDVPGLFLED
jgi:hypothetical protein